MSKKSDTLDISCVHTCISTDTNASISSRLNHYFYLCNIPIIIEKIVEYFNTIRPLGKDI